MFDGFFGEYEYNLDDKGRVALPTKYREAMGESVILWRGMDGQVNVYPVANWEKIATKVAGQNQARQAARHISRLVFAANECPIDKQGRILVPPTLREHGALLANSNLVVLGNGDHLELWCQDRWRAVTQQMQTDGSEIAEKMAELGLEL
jgi:MraZ protein